MKASAVAELPGARGQSIWLVDTRQIVDRLKTSAYIEQASASVALPDRLTISVIERRPEVRWQSGGRYTCSTPTDACSTPTRPRR